VLTNSVKKLVPSFIKRSIRKTINGLVDWGENKVLSSMYTPEYADSNENRFYFFSSDPLTVRKDEKTLPVPPANMRMGYSTNSDDEFLERGRKTALMIRSVWKEYEIKFGRQDSVLDFGCAASRVLRHFADEAATSEFWGVDQDEYSILWNKLNLAPPFNFVINTTYPHLPFEDRKFSFIYGISVFTHTRHLADTWLMELNRILKPGGYALFTIMDENAVQVFKTQGRHNWVPDELNLDDVIKHDMVIVKGIHWNGTFTIYHSKWIRKEWGRYFDVLDIKPHAEDNYQSAVILRKR
jgi:SAM-dependent methyltransferase